MSYNVTLRDSDFFIPWSSVPAVLADLKRDMPYLEGPSDAYASINDIAHELRWEFDLSEVGDVVNLWIEDNGGDGEEDMFRIIAPYVQDGSSVEMVGEDGELWRYYWTGGRYYRQEGLSVNYDMSKVGQ